MHRFTNQFVEYCRKNYGEELEAVDERAYCYNSLPICILDCVYSLRATYKTTTVPLVERYAERFLGGDKTAADESDTLTDFINNLTSLGLDNFADHVVRNHQKSGGVPKAKVCFDVAKALRELGIETVSDFKKYPSEEILDSKIRTVKGMGDAGVNYLFMLAGDENRSKPDVHIHRCIVEACGEDVSNAECRQIIEEAAGILKETYPNLTVRKLDGAIWKDFSSRKKQRRYA